MSPTSPVHRASSGNPDGVQNPVIQPVTPVAVVDFDYKQTAAACGVSDSTAYKVLVSKERKPSFEVACRMADHLGITMDQLRKMILDGEGDEELELGTQDQTQVA